MVSGDFFFNAAGNSGFSNADNSVCSPPKLFASKAHLEESRVLYWQVGWSVTRLRAIVKHAWAATSPAKLATISGLFVGLTAYIAADARMFYTCLAIAVKLCTMRAHSLSPEWRNVAG